MQNLKTMLCLKYEMILWEIYNSESMYFLILYPSSNFEGFNLYLYFLMKCQFVFHLQMVK